MRKLQNSKISSLFCYILVFYFEIFSGKDNKVAKFPLKRFQLFFCLLKLVHKSSHIPLNRFSN